MNLNSNIFRGLTSPARRAVSESTSPTGSSSSPRPSTPRKGALARAVHALVGSPPHVNLGKVLPGNGSVTRLRGMSSMVLAKINVLSKDISVVDLDSNRPESSSNIHKQSPFEMVITTLKGPTRSARSAASVLKLLPQLTQAIDQKQGVVFLGTHGARDQGTLLSNHIRKHGAIDINESNRLIGAYPIQQGDLDADGNALTSLWMLKVHDRNLDMTIEVPMTQVVLGNLGTNDQITTARNNISKHLLKIHPAFQDSPTQPAIVCPENPRFSQIICGIEEVASREMRGEMVGKHLSQYVNEIGEVVQKLACTDEVFYGDEAFRLDQYAGEHLSETYDPSLPNPRSVGALGDLEWNLLNADVDVHPNRIRAFKRHTMAEIAAPKVATEPAPGANVGLTLEGHRPQTKPQERIGGQAFKQQAQQMQCGLQAINGFFQTDVVNSTHTAVFTIQRYQSTMEAMGVTMGSLKGMGHPDVIGPLLRGENARISKATFLGDQPRETSVFNDQTPKMDWEQLVNLKNPGKNWVSNQQELNKISELEISPDEWLSCQRGMSAEDAKVIINQLLANKNDTWSHLPDQVSSQVIGTGGMPALRAGQQIEADLRYQPLGQDSPMIVMQGNAGSGNHYYTLLPDAQGNWLSLNADGTRQDGLQTCQLWAQKGELGNKLKEANIGLIIR